MNNGLTPITIVGNLGGDPELRFTPSGAAVASFSVAVTPRRLNRETGAWEDGAATWWRVNAWRALAENCAESLTKGARVIVVGTVAAREWTDQKTSEKKTTFEIQADEIGPGLTFATATVTRSTKRDQAPPPEDPRGSGGAVHRSRPAEAAATPADPWANGGTGSGSWGGGYSDEPPF